MRQGIAMDYKGWIMAIYDRYKQKYNERYLTNKNRRKFKNLTTKDKLKIIFYFILVIGGGISYFIGILLNNPIIFVIGILVEIIPPMILVYKTKFKMWDYKRCVNALRDVLEEENINTVPAIKKLIKDTAGVLYKIKDGEVNNYIKLLSFVSGAVGVAFGVGNYLDKLEVKNNDMAVILKLFIGIAIIGGMIYIIILVMPGSKYEKRKELHEILKILLIYEEGKKIQKLGVILFTKI